MQLISIHAPTRGATSDSLDKLISLPVFQSTPLQEERQFVLENIVTNYLFQSTPLQEERHSVKFDIDTYSLFQSTPLQEERHFRLVATGVN